ncbi:carbohydrate porin [Granulicella sibirica]|uniref:Carbohydrate-selective porin n=1 Tax=Granulicella sibirica TaxID=2479048 RepID=A0A4Q0T321_9BACT|nr:carbohydrate porin [Granulicella sibirica]RXH56388.1 Carbohydrate-selective porin [Granulicella sibirica]
MPSHLSRLIAFTLLAASLTRILPAQESAQPATEAQTDSPASPPKPEDPPATLFPHSDKSRFLIVGQTNIIFQAHGPFHTPYSGPNSLLGRGEYKTSLLGTLYLGAQVIRNPRASTDFLIDVESSGGRGISEALGLGGFTNLDVVRNPSLGSKPYIARVQLHEVIGVGGELTEAERTPFSLSTSVPTRRFDLRFGKMSLPDVIDLNSIGTDSHLQFMNWTVDNNGAWDYAADTRGYTYAGVAEYDDKIWSARYALGLMPTVANGIDVDWNVRRARGENTEFEFRRTPFSAFLPKERKGAVRLLGFVNHANMGVYRDSIKAFEAGLTKVPDITAHAPGSTVKYGVGLNFEQEITENTRIYGRFGWNEGQHQSFAYTEVDQTFAFGADYFMRRYGRPLDKAGITFVSNAIKRDHQNYLRLGGLGFLLGDNGLNYAREDILEGYYNLHAWRGVFYALDGQFVEHPGYNQDRGPVLVESVRMHVDF